MQAIHFGTAPRHYESALSAADAQLQDELNLFIRISVNEILMARPKREQNFGLQMNTFSLKTSPQKR